MRPHLFAPSIIALCLTGASATAQIKLPVFEDDSPGTKNVLFQEATRPQDFQHGRLVRLTLKGEDKSIEGILVRVDRKSDRIYVRTQPGLPPRAFDAKNIAKIEKGTIKNVSTTQDVTRPEIQPLVIVNGVQRSVSYAAPTLSPSEQAVLRELETSENRLQRLEFTASRTRLQQDIEFGIQAEHLRTQALQNELLWRQIYDRFNPRLMPWIMPITANTSSINNGLPPTAAAPVAQSSAEALAKARQNYADVQNRVIYQSGQPVAVILDDTK